MDPAESMLLYVHRMGLSATNILRPNNPRGTNLKAIIRLHAQLAKGAGGVSWGCSKNQKCITSKTYSYLPL